jgi:4'-phosphopantetheinyl transferase
MIESPDAGCAARVAVVAWPEAGLESLLAANEAVVCCALVQDGRRELDALARAVLRAALGDACETEIAHTATGKPYLVAPRVPLNFNISHSGDAIVVALSRSAEVGVDIERVRAVPEWRAVAARVFDARSRDELLAEVACGADEDDAFIRRWCRMEAAVKATGEGIFAREPRDDASDRHTGRATPRIVDLSSLPFTPGAARYRAALAIRP